MKQEDRNLSFVVGKNYTFEAAHKIPDHKGKCKNLHGHSYKVLVEVKPKPGFEHLSYNGMVIDFAEIDKAVEPIIEELDHSYLNRPMKDPTAEVIAAYIALEADDALLDTTVTVSRVRVHETAKCYAEVHLDASN